MSVAEELRLHGEGPTLTEREVSVLKLLLQGGSNKDIATNLGCAVKTVEFHISNLLRKHNVLSRLELVVKVHQPTAP